MSDEIDGKRVGPHDVNRALRNLEAKGLIWSAIDANGQLRYYTTEGRPRPADPDRGNVTSLGNSARKRRRARYE